MASDSTRGQASPYAHFFHVSYHQRGDKKWHALEVNGDKRATCKSSDEALEKIRDWVNELEAKGNSHVYIHDEHGKIRKEENY